MKRNWLICLDDNCADYGVIYDLYKTILILMLGFSSIGSRFSLEHRWLCKQATKFLCTCKCLSSLVCTVSILILCLTLVRLSWEWVVE